MPGVTLTYSVITRVNDIPYRVCLLLEERGEKSIEGGRGVGGEKKWGVGGGRETGTQRGSSPSKTVLVCVPLNSMA